MEKYDFIISYLDTNGEEHEVSFVEEYDGEFTPGEYQSHELAMINDLLKQPNVSEVLSIYVSLYEEEEE